MADVILAETSDKMAKAVTHAKAERELGFRPSGADLALRRAATWFEANGYC